MRNLLTTLGLILATAAVSVFAERSWFKIQEARKEVAAAQPEIPHVAQPTLTVDPQRPDTLKLDRHLVESLGIRLEPISLPRFKDHLTLTGSLFIDSNRLAYVHSRFDGEVVQLGTIKANVPEGSGEHSDLPPERAIQVGDNVKAGQILAVVWSKEIGEKKSDLIDALSRQYNSKATLARLEGLPQGTVAGQLIRDARRQYESDIIAVERAERTLRSWKETDEEIAEVYHEADRIREGKPRSPERGLEQTWANVEIRAPFDSTIMEKNVTAGEIIESTEVLFKVADLSRMGVLANVYEEDIPKLVSLPQPDRNWRVRLKAEPEAKPIAGRFDVIGSVIDPGQHTAAVIGWIDNPDRMFRAGQFITATIDLPPPSDVLVVPNSSVIDEGSSAWLFTANGPDASEVTMRRVEVVRRGRDLALVKRHPNWDSESAPPPQPLEPGDLVVVSGNLELYGAMQNATVASQSRPTESRPN